MKEVAQCPREISGGSDPLPTCRRGEHNDDDDDDDDDDASVGSAHIARSETAAARELAAGQRPSMPSTTPTTTARMAESMRY